MIGDAEKHVGEPSLWIDAVEFCRGDQGVHRYSQARSPPQSEPANNHARRPRAIPPKRGRRRYSPPASFDIDIGPDRVAALVT
jgi:hypothetical protein